MKCQGFVISACIKFTLEELVFSRAFASISSDRSTAVTCFAFSISHTVFFPVPQPISRQLSNAISASKLRSDRASRSRVLFKLVSYCAAQLLYASFTFIKHIFSKLTAKKMSRSWAGHFLQKLI